MISFQTGTGTNYVRCSQLAFWEEVKEDAQERWLCMASWGKWEMLWSPTRLSFSKVASDMGNLLIKRPAEYWKGFYLLLPSSSLKIRPASEAEVVHPQLLGNFDHLGCAWAAPWRMPLLSWLVMRTQRGEQFPGSFSRMIICMLIQAKFKADGEINEKLRELYCLLSSQECLS